MAASEATRRIRRTSRVTSPSDRRGAHAPVAARPETTPSHRSATPAMHITPNVVIASRGALRSARPERRGTSLRSLRRFAA